MCAVAYAELRAYVVNDQDRQYQHKEQLIAEVRRIAEKTRWVKRNRDGELAPDYVGLADAAGLSRGGLNGIVSGSEPQPRTLILLARYAGESPVALYQAAGWLTADDLSNYMIDRVDRYQRKGDQAHGLVDEALTSGDVTEEDILTALQVSRKLYQQIADRARGQELQQPSQQFEQHEIEEQG